MTKGNFLRWPQDDDELWLFVATVWDFEIPRVQVCPDHVAPFKAFADAYFARSPVSIWKASRGLGGKSQLLGILFEFLDDSTHSLAGQHVAMPDLPDWAVD